MLAESWNLIIFYYFDQFFLVKSRIFFENFVKSKKFFSEILKKYSTFDSEKLIEIIKNDQISKIFKIFQIFKFFAKIFKIFFWVIPKNYWDLEISRYDTHSKLLSGFHVLTLRMPALAPEYRFFEKGLNNNFCFKFKLWVYLMLIQEHQTTQKIQILRNSIITGLGCS